MVTIEELVTVRNQLIDLREKSMDSWGVEYQTSITVALAHAIMPISEILETLGMDLNELNNARIRSKT